MNKRCDFVGATECRFVGRVPVETRGEIFSLMNPFQPTRPSRRFPVAILSSSALLQCLKRRVAS